MGSALCDAEGQGQVVNKEHVPLAESVATSELVLDAKFEGSAFGTKDVLLKFPPTMIHGFPIVFFKINGFNFRETWGQGCDIRLRIHTFLGTHLEKPVSNFPTKLRRLRGAKRTPQGMQTSANRIFKGKAPPVGMPAPMARNC